MIDLSKIEGTGLKWLKVSNKLKQEWEAIGRSRGMRYNVWELESTGRWVAEVNRSSEICTDGRPAKIILQVVGGFLHARQVCEKENSWPTLFAQDVK